MGVKLLGLVALALSAQFAGPVPDSGDVGIEALYRSGRLGAAAAADKPGLLSDAQGMIACRLKLYANRLLEARLCLMQRLKANPSNKTAQALLAETEYRARNFMASASAFEAAGRLPLAERLRHFGANGPYRMPTIQRLRSVGFERLDPLPVVKARVNGGPELNFIIDTGAADTVLDIKVARAAGAKLFGDQAGLFAGGATGSFTYGAIDRLQVGTLDVSAVPVIVLDTSAYKEAFSGLEIGGIIGTGLLSQYRSTIDYPGRNLAFAPRASHGATKGIAVPIWFVGDHFILAEAGMNGREQLAFIDTGLAGLGCTAPQSTLDGLGIKAGAAHSGGVGGSGQSTMVAAFEADVSLGKAYRKGVGCVLGPFPAQLESLAGTRIGMLISHAFLKPYAVTLDFDKMRMILSDPSKGPARAR